MMRLGSVILKVEPQQVADRMWYFPLLKPYHDHVPVKADLSDLEEKIAWCRAHDDECRKIGENAKIFYEKYVARRALLDYVEMVCKHIAKRNLDPPSWWQPPPRSVDPPSLRKPDAPCYKGRGANDADRLCIRCQEDYDTEVKEAAEAEKEKTYEILSGKKRKENLRARMRERAKKLKVDDKK